jgi:hypothetical protein
MNNSRRGEEARRVQSLNSLLDVLDPRNPKS